MTKIIIWGNTRLSSVVAEFINESEGNRVVAFSIDRNFTKGLNMFKGLPLVPFEELVKIYPPDSHQILITVTAGSKAQYLNEIKYKEAIKMGYKPFSFIHPKAYVARSASIGDNCIICPNVTVEPNAILNNGVFIRSAAYVSHDTEIGKFSYLAPGATVSGSCKIGNHCFLGTNSTVRDRINVGNNTIIGAGAVVLRDLMEDSILKAAECELMPINRNRVSL